jgi:hypothetical protein
MPAPIDPKDYDLPAQPTTADVLRSLPFVLKFAKEAAPAAFWMQSFGAVPLAFATALGTIAVKRVGDAVFAGDASAALVWSAALVGAVAAVAFVRFLKMRAGETLRHRLQLAAEEKQMTHLMSVSAEVAESSWFQRLAGQYRDKAWRINGISWQIPNIVEDVAVLLGASTVFAFVPWPAGVAVVVAAVLRFFLARGETAWEWDVFDFEKRDGRRAKYLSHVLTRPEHRPGLFAYGSYMVRPKTNRWPIIYPGRELGEDSVPNSSAAVVHLDVGLGYCAGQDAVQIWHNSTDGSEEVAQQAAGYVLAAGGDYTLTINGFNGCVPEATTVVDRPVEQLHPSIKGQLPSSLPNAGHGPLR